MCGSKGCLLLIAVETAWSQPNQVPLYHGCLSDVAKKLPFCDASLDHETRVNDLISRLELDEKISLLSPTKPPYCACHTPPVPRLGLPMYKWLTEVNTDVV